MVLGSPIRWAHTLSHVLSGSHRANRTSLFSSGGQGTAPASVKDCGSSSVSSPEMEKDRRTLAHQGHHGWYSSTMDGGPPTIQSPVRFGDLSAKSHKGIRRVQQDSSVLSRNRLSGSIVKSVRDRWSLVNILSGGKEGHGQASGMHRPSDDQSLSAVPALQDGGHTHSGLHAPPAGLHDQNRPVRFLHAFAHCRARPQVLPVHVQRHKIRMHGHAIRPRSGTSHCNQVFAASNQVPAPQRSQMHGVHRRYNHSGSQQGAIPQAHPVGSGSSTQSGVRHPSGQAAGRTETVSRVSGASSQLGQDAVPSAAEQDSRPSSADSVGHRSVGARHLDSSPIRFINRQNKFLAGGSFSSSSSHLAASAVACSSFQKDNRVGQAHGSFPSGPSRIDMVARRDPIMERQVGDPGQASVHSDHRCKSLGLGMLVEAGRSQTETVRQSSRLL